MSRTADQPCWQEALQQLLASCQERDESQRPDDRCRDQADLDGKRVSEECPKQWRADGGHKLHHLREGNKNCAVFDGHLFHQFVKEHQVKASLEYSGNTCKNGNVPGHQRERNHQRVKRKAERGP